MRERTNRTVRAAAVALILFLLTGAAASAAAEQSILDFIGEIADSPLPAGAAELVRPIMHRETVNDVEITILDAAYDGRTLFLRYNFRMTDVDAPLGVTAEELFGDELPEDIAPGTYVYCCTPTAPAGGPMRSGSTASRWGTCRTAPASTSPGPARPAS